MCGIVGDFSPIWWWDVVLYSIGTSSILWRLGLPFVFSSGGFGIVDGLYSFTNGWVVLFVVGGLFGLCRWDGGQFGVGIRCWCDVGFL